MLLCFGFLGFVYWLLGFFKTEHRHTRRVISLKDKANFYGWEFINQDIYLKIHKLLNTLHYCMQKTFSLAETVTWVILEASLSNTEKRKKKKKSR